MSRNHFIINILIILYFGSNANTEPLVTVGEVTYRGVATDFVEHFHHIKYAHDTSGDRRFAPPEPFIPSDEIIDATLPGPACPQLQNPMPPYFSAVDEISEDCLHLRISRPAGLNITAESKLPVVVWLYGGGVVRGSSTDPHFEPENVLKLSASIDKPIIYAAMNYRLNIFGFARSSTLKDQKSLNNGLRDQRLGFQWIKDNIKAFGGDPERITAYGLSTGGAAISLHTMAYGGERGVPFQQAWIISGPPNIALNITSDVTAFHTLAVAEMSGCGDLSDSEMINCLRKLSMRSLLDTATEYSILNNPPGGLFTFFPSVDEDFIPDSLSNLMQTGNFTKGIRMILGWTQDDGAVNVGIGHLIQNEEDMATRVRSFANSISMDQLSDLFSLYPPSSFQEELHNYEARKNPADPSVTVHYFRIARILRDMLFTCSSIDFGYQMVKHTSLSIDPDFTEVRLYDLNQSALAPFFKAAGMPYINAAHGSDTIYIFNGLFPEGEMSKEDLELAEKFTRALIDFAYTGDPISTELSKNQFSEWPLAYSQDSIKSEETSPSSLKLQVIGGPLGTGSVHVDEQEQFDSFDVEKEDSETSNGYSDFGRLQHVLSDVLEYKAMKSSKSTSRKQQIREQELFKRCAYIKSLRDVLGV